MPDDIKETIYDLRDIIRLIQGMVDESVMYDREFSPDELLHVKVAQANLKLALKGIETRV